MSVIWHTQIVKTLSQIEGLSDPKKNMFLTDATGSRYCNVKFVSDSRNTN